MSTVPDVTPVAPTDDPDYYRMVDECGDWCHHPVHALGSPARRRHLVERVLVETFPHEYPVERRR